MAEWFERWFGEEYLALYPHRDERDAAAAIALIDRELAARTGTGPGRILDLACGAGRHARMLARLGWTVGLDLSPTLLRVARRNDPAGAYVRGDMRVLPFADLSFGLVTNLFTSFGYFADDREHERVLMEVRRVLRPGGTFVLDYLNASQVRASLVPCDEREVAGVLLEQKRAITNDGRYVVKRITIRDDGRTFMERVRLFTRSDLRTMLTRHGLRVYASFGDYSGSPQDDASPRAIFFAAREDAVGVTPPPESA